MLEISFQWLTQLQYIDFEFALGVPVSKPFINTYNITNGTCPNPTFLGQYSGIGDICPPGSYCPRGSDRPKNCPAGTYYNGTGASKCTLCPPGYYCLENFVTYLNTECPSGYYCPGNTTTPTENPCPPGTFNNLTGQHSELSCVSCTKGSYCQGSGLHKPTNLCSSGWYCNGSATLSQTTTHGGQCQAGFYCPMGAYRPIPCDAGKFCNAAGLDKPTGNCSAGFFCKLGAWSSTPTDKITGDECPFGHFCPEGSFAPTACVPGTYLDSKRSISSSSCKACTAGWYCNASGLETPVGKCAAGYYCTGGQDSRTPVSKECPAGHYCPEGTDKPLPCRSGTYQDMTRKDYCKHCPERYYCNATNGGVVSYTAYPCIAGYFCPNSTTFAEQYPCDYGTYSNLTGLASQSECSPCLGGYYCGERGLTNPRTLCSDGFYCRRGRYILNNFFFTIRN